MNYRPEIDGLRAIAVLLVLSFHAGLKFFPSGFIGVDIFFVISGFLITGIIHDSLQNNHFSFAEFYNRRLWRLQPVLICLIVSTTILTLFFYLPEDLLPYVKSARKTALFISNNYFEGLTKDYFAPNNNELPLLHTWSLSIEWQCYFILPLVIYLLHRFFDKRYCSRIIYLLTLLAFATTLFLSATEPLKTYYHLTSRIVEFLIGSCIVYGPNRFSVNKYFLALLNAGALFFIFYAATRSNIHSGFPNGYALILCSAVAIIIASREKSAVSMMLSLKPIVFIGLISYSLYIWHWPVFVFMRYFAIPETTSTLLAAFSLIFIMAFFSWRFIELPTRKFNKIKFRYSLVYLFLLPVLLTHVSNHLVKRHEGYPQRFAEIARIETELKPYVSSQRKLCLEEKDTEISADCVLGSKNPTHKTGFMFGDSHSNHFWLFMDTLAQKANLSIVAHAVPACLTLPGIQQYDWRGKVYTACHQQTERYYTMIKANHYDFVILTQNWNGYFTDKLMTNEPKKQIEHALDKALKIIIASGAKPVLIKSIVPSSAYSCFQRHLKLRKRYDPQACDFDKQTQTSQWQNKLFLRLKSKYAQLIIIDPTVLQCPREQCKSEINGIPLFQDRAGHLHDYASYHFAVNYLKQFDNPLAS